MPPKNMISVTRNTHIPRVAASFCCAIVVEVMLQPACDGVARARRESETAFRQP